MCRTGRTHSFFTDAEKCFVGSDLRMYHCNCPITTCVDTSTGYACQITTSFLVICGFLLLIWLLAVAAYVYVSRLVDELHRASRPERCRSAGGGGGGGGGGYYYEKLFGSAKAAAEADALPKRGYGSCN